ncbi:MAG: glutamate 5-kinase [Candidatus Gracilibacteria bacterium]|jgi:glutamate 5-kinase
MRFVVKIGSNLLTRPDNSLNTEFISQMTAQIAELHKKGHEPIIVTSGAVAAGRKSITFKKESKTIPYRQALAAVGQTFLLETYQDNFAKYGIVIGQVLLTLDDLKQHDHFLSTYNTLDLLLKMRVIPILNENDVTTFNENKFGNNDKLSGHIASLLTAETLIMLTDVDGLYDADPRSNPEAKLIQTVDHITAKLKAAAKGSGTSKGIGGMLEKLKAAEYANASGVKVWIARGGVPNVLVDLIEGKKHHGTLFTTKASPREARRRWFQLNLKQSAALHVDEGAVAALTTKGKSLLPAGIRFVEGHFKRGDIVSMLDPTGKKIGFGKINYDSSAVETLKGAQTDKIERLLGYTLGDEIIGRDNMVICLGNVEKNPK